MSESQLDQIQEYLEELGLIFWHGDLNELLLSEKDLSEMGFLLVLGGTYGKFGEMNAVAVLLDQEKSAPKEEIATICQEWFQNLIENTSGVKEAEMIRVVGIEQYENPGILSMQIYASDAYQIEVRQNTLSSNFMVLLRNHEELIKLLNAAESENAEALWYQEKATEMSTVQQEIVRLLHNYLASAKTLIEHTRIIMNDGYSQSDFINEYNQEIKTRFIGNALTQFIEKLRDYSLHYRLPFTTAISKADSRAFVLQKTELSSWNSWTAKGKEYLDSCDEDIVILEIANEYFFQIDAFHDWIAKRLLEIHDQELRWLDQMGLRVKKALGERNKKV